MPPATTTLPAKLYKVEFFGYEALRPVTKEPYFEREFDGPDGLRWKRPEVGLHPTKSVRFYPADAPAIADYKGLGDYGIKVKEVTGEEARAHFIRNPRPLPELHLLPRGAPIEETHRVVLPESLKTAEDRRAERQASRPTRKAKEEAQAAADEAADAIQTPAATAPKAAKKAKGGAPAEEASGQ